MKRKSRKPAATAKPTPAPAPAADRLKTWHLVAAVGGGFVLFVVVMWLVLAPKSAPARSEAELAALQRPHAASFGDAGAKVTIVEFMDPACDTCREFYPLVKGIMSDNPGRIRLSIRLVAFHPGSDVPVKALEAAKAQGKFEMVLDRLFATQPNWVVQHRADAQAAMEQLRTLDLDFARLQADMESPEVLRNVALDAQDAKTLKVVQTPEYFVNGRGLPEFGYEPLRSLVRNEVAAAYR
ncbi:MAG TPA: thioredoxin domain-containing protein [Casimicrobiaceae bacterium]|nr:thioredoxin domain-containing protein [Casimicrobiaceae bacterium]